MKDDDRWAPPDAGVNAFEEDKASTNARSNAEAAIEDLRQRGGVFVNAVRATRMPMALTDPNLPGNPIVFANDAFLKLSGYTMDEVLGQQPFFMNGPGTDANDAARFAETIRSDQDDIIESVQYRKDGSRFVATVLLSAFKDDEGRTLNHFISWLDVTRRVDAEHEATDLRKTQAALLQSEERLRLIVENAQDYAIFTTDPTGTVTDWREGAEAVFGYSSEEMIGQNCDVLFTPEDRKNDQPNRERSTAAEQGKASDVRWHLRKDGSRVFIDGVSTALRDRADELIGFLKIGQDVTQRHFAEERLRTLLAELQHRVRNTLALVKSITTRTAESSESVEEMAAHLTGRLDAFARVQSAVTRNPDAGVNLMSLLTDELLAHAAHEGEEFTAKGPPLALQPKAAESLSLALHELTTNAVKHGALNGHNGGRIAVSWNITGNGRGRHVAFTWSEHHSNGKLDGPTHDGFGMELLKRILPYDLGAKTDVRFGRDGIRFTMQLPIKHVIDGSHAEA